MKSNKIVFLSITVLFVILSSVLTQAQFKKGNWLVEGNVGNISLSNNTYDNTEESLTSKTEYSSFAFNLNPKAGFFISNDIAIGLMFGFNFYNTSYESFDSDGKKDSESESGSTSISFAPFLRYYLPGSSNSNLRFYGQVGGGISTDLSSKSEYTGYNTSGVITSKSKTEYPEKYFGYFVEGLIGLNYFLAQNVALNTAIGYNYGKSSQTSEYTYTPTNGTPQVYPQTESKNTSGNIIWNIGFTMIIP
jgi:hypothetical protein